MPTPRIHLSDPAAVMTASCGAELDDWNDEGWSNPESVMEASTQGEHVCRTCVDHSYAASLDA